MKYDLITRLYSFFLALALVCLLAHLVSADTNIYIVKRKAFPTVFISSDSFKIGTKTYLWKDVCGKDIKIAGGQPFKVTRVIPIMYKPLCQSNTDYLFVLLTATSTNWTTAINTMITQGRIIKATDGFNVIGGKVIGSLELKNGIPSDLWNVIKTSVTK